MAKCKRGSTQQGEAHCNYRATKSQLCAAGRRQRKKGERVNEMGTALTEGTTMARQRWRTKAWQKKRTSFFFLPRLCSPPLPCRCRSLASRWYPFHLRVPFRSLLQPCCAEFGESCLTLFSTCCQQCRAQAPALQILRATAPCHES